MKKIKVMHVFVFLIMLLIATFLRFYNLEERFLFSGEIGHNLLEIKNAFEGHSIPLIGPPTSHPWLSFGPFFYWIYGPILYLFNFNPLSYAYFGAFISVCTVALNFFVIRSIFNYRVAVISSVLMSVSPLFLSFSLGARFFAVIPLLSLIFLYMTVNIVRKKSKSVFLYGFLFGAMFSFHYTPIMLLPFMLSVVLFARLKIERVGLLSFIGGFLLAVLPIIVYDFLNNTQMVKNIILWIPYRVAGFLGFYPKNTLSEFVVSENASSIWSFFSESILPRQLSFISAIIYLSVTVYIFYIVKNAFKRKKFLNGEFILFVLMFWGLVSVFIHGSPPIHYFVPILFAPIIFISLFLDNIFKTRNGKIVVVLLVFFIVFANLKYFFSSEWFYRQGVPQNVMYKEQKNIAKYIILQAGGTPFSLARIGVNDQFEGDYAQNYVYLLWLYGNEPKHNAKMKFTIYEDASKFSMTKSKNKVVVGEVGITKE